MAASAPRVAVAVGAGASAEVVEDFGAPMPGGSSFTNAVLEAHLAEVPPPPLLPPDPTFPAGSEKAAHQGTPWCPIEAQGLPRLKLPCSLAIDGDEVTAMNQNELAAVFAEKLGLEKPNRSPSLVTFVICGGEIKGAGFCRMRR